MATSIQNLDSRFPIVNEDGTPTEYFMRLLNDRGNTQEETQGDIAGKADKSTQIIAGGGLSGGGDLSQDRTLNLNAVLGDLTDVDMTTTPPTNGQAPIWSDADQLWLPGDAGGGGGGSFEFIAEIEADGTSPTLTLGSIPAGYAALELRYHGATTTAISAEECWIQFNGDASAVYDYDRQYGGSSNGGATYNNSTAFAVVAYMNGNADQWSSGSLTLPNYDTSDQVKSIYGIGRWDNITVNWGGMWRNLNPVTSISFTLQGAGNFRTGSRLQLWGLKAEASGGGGGGVSAFARMSQSTNYSRGSTQASMEWDTVDFEEGGITLADTANNRFLIPAGVNFVEVSAGYNSGDASSWSVLGIGKNGIADSNSVTFQTSGSDNFGRRSCTSGPIAVVGGDWFQAWTRLSSTVTINATSPGTFFSIKVLG